MQWNWFGAIQTNTCRNGYCKCWHFLEGVARYRSTFKQIAFYSILLKVNILFDLIFIQMYALRKLCVCSSSCRHTHIYSVDSTHTYHTHGYVTTLKHKLILCIKWIERISRRKLHIKCGLGFPRWFELKCQFAQFYLWCDDCVCVCECECLCA